MANFIVAVIILIVIGAAIAYIIKEKKRGVTCIGCPHAGECARKHNQASGCSGDEGCGCHTEGK